METMERFRDLERSTDKYEYYENSYPGTRWWAAQGEVRVVDCVTKVVCRFTKICSHNSVLQIKKLSDLFLNLHLQSRVVLCVADNHDSWVRNESGESCSIIWVLWSWPIWAIRDDDSCCCCKVAAQSGHRFLTVMAEVCVIMWHLVEYTYPNLASLLTTFFLWVIFISRISPISATYNVHACFYNLLFCYILNFTWSSDKYCFMTRALLPWVSMSQ